MVKQTYWEKSKEKQKEYESRPEIKARRKVYWKEYQSRQEQKTKKKEYQSRIEVKAKRKEYQKEYQSRPELKEKKNIISRKRRKEDLIWALQLKIRNRLSFFLRNFTKTGKIKSCFEYGIDFESIIKHLQPFPKDINNYHVDHIVPLSWFDFNNPKEIKWAFAPENHQWLTMEENIRKGNRFIWVKDKK